MIPPLLSGNPLGTMWITYFPTFMQASMLLSNSETLNCIMGNVNTKEQLS